MAIIEVESLSAHYITGLYGIHREIHALDGVSLAIERNEVLGIAGESGCGKTTFMRVLLGMVKPPLTVVGGVVRYELGGAKIDFLDSRENGAARVGWSDVSYVPQGSMSVLNPVRRVERSFRDFVEANLPMSRRGDYERLVLRQLADLGLPREVLRSYPHQLSGGMRQRVIIALATILRPKVIFADEPTSALDVVAQRGVIQLLRKIHEEQQNSTVLVSHDMGIHANLADRVVIMYAGNLVEVGRSEAIFEAPVHPYTQYLIHSLPKVGDRSAKSSVPGTPPPLANPPAGCRFHPRCPHAMDICREEVPKMIEVAEGHRTACHWVEQGRNDG